MPKQNSLTIAIVTGQGTIKRREGWFSHYSEFDEDSRVHLGHMAWVPEIMRGLQPDLLIAAGGYTRPETRGTSEGESFVQFWSSTQWPRVPIAIDDLSLDTSENIILGLMTARMSIEGLITPTMPGAGECAVKAAKVSDVAEPSRTCRPSIRIEKVVIVPCWRFKGLRFAMVAQAVGLQQWQVRGYSEACDARAADGACSGEAFAISRMVATQDPLMLGSEWYAKKRARFAGSEVQYRRRLDEVRGVFKGTFRQLDRLQKSPQGLDALRRSIREEILG